MEVEGTKMALLTLMLCQSCVSKTALNKLMFFTDYCYSVKYGNFEKTITNDEYVKMLYGPVPKHIEDVKNFCIANDYLKREIRETHTRISSYYTLNIPFNELDIDILSKEEYDTVKLVNAKLSNYASSSLSYFSHVIEPWKSSDYWDVLTPQRMKEDDIYRTHGVTDLYELLEKDKFLDVIDGR